MRIVLILFNSMSLRPKLVTVDRNIRMRCFCLPNFKFPRSSLIENRELLKVALAARASCRRNTTDKLFPEKS